MGIFRNKRFLALGFIIVLLAAIPFTIFLLQRQQQSRSGAVKATSITFTPSSQSTTVGGNVSFDIMINPGTNQVSFVKLSLQYDATKLGAASASGTCSESLCANASAFPATLEGPVYSTGTTVVTLSVGADPTRVIQAPTKVGTVTFKALAPTNGTPTQITFGTDTQVLSIASADQPSENVLSTTSPAAVTIDAGAITPTVAASPTPTVVAVASTTPSPTTATNQIPTCTSLTTDRTPSGASPFSVAFTANGSDTDGTISKVTFNFGDGPINDVTVGGGIGTNAVSVQQSHTYNNAGTFTATSTMTDDKGGVSTTTTCTQTVTVTAAVPTVAPTAVPTAIPTAVPTQVAVVTQPPALPPTGPGDTMLLIGGLGAILTVVGGLLFFVL